MKIDKQYILPKICVNCGAHLSSFKCEYCGTIYEITKQNENMYIYGDGKPVEMKQYIDLTGRLIKNIVIPKMPTKLMW